MQPRYVVDKDAVAHLNEYINNLTDVNELARLYSLLLVDYPIIVVPSATGKDDSDCHLDGDPV